MNCYERYVEGLGFSGVIQRKTRAPKTEVAGFTFGSVDPAAVRACLGRPKAHKPDLFFYRIAKDKAVLINTEKNRVFLANGERAVAALRSLVHP